MGHGSGDAGCDIWSSFMLRGRNAGHEGLGEFLARLGRDAREASHAILDTGRELLPLGGWGCNSQKLQGKAEKERNKRGGEAARRGRGSRGFPRAPANASGARFASGSLGCPVQGLHRSLGRYQAGSKAPPAFYDRLKAFTTREKFPFEKDTRDFTCICFLTPALLLPRMLCPLLALGALALSLAGAMEVQVPDEPVVALFGQDATLDCSFSPDANFSLDDLTLIWQLTDTKRLVHSFSGGRDQLLDQGGDYANRTALFYDQLAQGNVSLLLRRVEVSDEGSFTCFVRDSSSAAVTLQVAAPYSKPSMYLEPNKDLKPGDLVAVTCHASRGYPQASVLWQDGQGSNITENITTSQVANEEGLFDVQSVLQVLVEPSSTYFCLVRNPVLQEETRASVTITGQHPRFPTVALWVTVALAICVLGLLIVLAYVCQKKIRESCEEEEENAGTEEQIGEGEQSKTALQPLKSKESKDDNEQEID
ncbi:CD276 antigen isoform X3 [Columba livia]|uniref:CD276 antigen isoform X3 n=1 Tax=Columba livia TaxID=8932 RepID=UPI0031BA46DE